jgi:hypothetical protein
MLELQGPGTALLDEPLALRVRGAGPDASLLWHARLRDDDGLVWRARAERPEDLPAAWRGKAERAALGSLRPLRIDVRVEAADGQTASRTFTRLLVAEGVRIRRWRDGLRATLHLPAVAPAATALIDAREHGEAVTIAAPLLASRGVLVLALHAGEPAVARERLAAVPGAGAIREVAGSDIPIPPGAPGGDPDAWGACLSQLGAPGA